VRPRDFLTAAVHGSAAGAGATLAMSAVMLAAERLGMMGRHPPERIVERGIHAAGRAPTRREVDAAATVAHIGFGAASGAVFALIARSVRPRVPEQLAIPFALAVWLVSYFGWIPALGIMPPPDEDRPGRAWTMLAAHAVYGATLGALWRAVGVARR
jgi:hypothetical protein